MPKHVETKPVEWFEENLKNMRASEANLTVDLNRTINQLVVIRAEIVELSNLIRTADTRTREIRVDWRDKMKLRDRIL